MIVIAAVLAATVFSGSAFAVTEESAPPAVPPLFAKGEANGAVAPRPPEFALSSPLSLEGGRLRQREFTSVPRDPFAVGDPVSVTQSALYENGGMTVRAEMGDLAIDEGPVVAGQLSRRGARFSLVRTDAGAGASITTFALTGARPEDDRSYLAGVVGRLSLLDSLQLKGLYVKGKEVLHPAGRDSDAALRGDVVGVGAAFDPYRGRLALDAYLYYALVDADTTDAVSPAGDVACRARLGGTAAGYRYGATYERTGPRYRIIGGSLPRRDWEGYRAALAREYGAHALEMNISRHNDNVEGAPRRPTLYRYEGVAEYRFTGVPVLPLGLSYRKEIDEWREQGGGRSGKNRDTVAGRLNYLAGGWDLGVRASLSQRSDLTRDVRDFAAATLSLAPAYQGGVLTVSPDLSLRRSYYLLEGQRTDEYAAGVDVRGCLLGRELDYQVKGGFRTVFGDTPAARRNSLHADVRLAYPLKGLFGALSAPIVGLRGEYRGMRDQARSDGGYSLHLVLEGPTSRR